MGVDRAVAAAVRGVGKPAVTAALPLLQPAVLTRPTARAIKQSGAKALDELRTAGAAAVGTEPPELAQLRRVSLGTLVMATVTLFGIVVLLPYLTDIGSALEAMKDAEWRWVLVGLALSPLQYLFDSIALLAALPKRVPIGPCTELMLASKFTNIATPAGAGSVAMDIRFMQKQGIDSATAVTSSVIINLTGTVAQFAIFGVALWISADSFDFGDVPGGSFRWVLLGLIVVGVGLAVALRFPRVRSWVIPPIERAKETLSRIGKSPGRLALLLLSPSLTAVVYALILGASLEAYGQHLNLATLLVANTAASTISNVVPTPGGLGVFEASMIAVLTAAGIPETQAFAATMTHRLITFWIPPFFGFIEFRLLRKRGLHLGRRSVAAGRSRRATAPF